MRFLFLNQYYPPDPAPTGWYLHGLAGELARRGHVVKVLCSRRAYDGSNAFSSRDNLDGVEISRLPATGFGRKNSLGRVMDYASFYASLAAALLLDRNKPDLILSLTTPPYIGLLGKAASKKRGCPHAHWIMDLYPDVISAHGAAKKPGWFLGLLGGLTRFQLHGAEAIFCLGDQMAEKVSAYVTKKRHESVLKTIPLWSDPHLAPWPADETNPLRVSRGWNNAEVVFLYSGNMGLGHRFTEFLGATKHLGRSGPRWIFSGGGKRKKQIEDFAKSHPDSRIEMLDYVPQELLRSHLCAADVHLASLESAWQGLIVPSKIQASFATARPVLFVGGRHCETANWIEESGGGWVVGPDDINGLLKAIEQALDPEERRHRGQAAFEFVRKKFQMSNNCREMAAILERNIIPLHSVSSRSTDLTANQSKVLTIP